MRQISNLKQLKYKIAIFLLIIAINILGYILFSSKIPIFKKDSIFIALVAPPVKSESGRNIVNSVNLYLNQINHQINGKRIELLYYEDNQNEKDAEKTALNISNESKALVVLGHYYSSTSLAAGTIYKRNEVAAITGSATAEEVTLNNEWYYRTIPNNKVQAIFIGNYIFRTLKKNTANILFEEDDYCVNLMENVEKYANRIGIKIKNTWKVDSAQTDDDTFKENINGKIDNNEIVFFATHTSVAAKVITYLKNKGKTCTMIGNDEFSSKEFLDKLKEYGNKNKGTDFYSDGIYCAIPYINSIANEKGQQFEKQFFNFYNKKPSWEAACYYDTISVAVEAIKKAEIKENDHLMENRRKVKDALDSFYSPKTGLKGIVENIYFDEQRNITRSYAIVRYNGQKLVSGLKQYQSVDEIKDSQELFEGIVKGEIITISGKRMKHTNIVSTFIDRIEFGNIDFNNSLCTLAFNIGFSYASNYAFDDNAIEFTNSPDSVTLGKPVSKDDKDGMTTCVYRVKGRFKTVVNLRTFPFDRHIINIRFKNKNDTADRVIYLPYDSKALSLSDRENLKGYDIGKSIQGWNIKSQNIYADFLTKESCLGLPRLAYFKHKINYSQLNMEIHLERKPGNIILNVFFPILSLIVILYLVFHYQFNPQLIKFYTGIFLLVIWGNAIYHFYLLSKFSCTYIMAVEYLNFAIYILVLLLLIIVKLFDKIYHQKNEKLLKEIILVGKIGYPILCLFGLFVFILIFKDYNY